MQGEEFGAWARCDSVGSVLIVAEFDEDGVIVKQLGYSANLPAHKLLRRKILQQCHYVEKRRPLGTFCLSHQSTQQVTKVGTLRQSARSRLFLHSTPVLSSDCGIAAPVSAPCVRRNPRGLAGLCRLKQIIPQPDGITALEPERLVEYPSFVAATGV
jgi:hypothetical protein